MVEYKAIGLTDYARFETNPDKRSDIMALGVANAQYVTDFDVSSATNPFANTPSYDLVTTYGASDAYVQDAGNHLYPNPKAGSGTLAGAGLTTIPGGGSIHSNGSVRFYGRNFFYLANNSDSAGAFGEGIEIGGDLLLDAYNTSSKTGEGTVELQANPTTNPATPASSVLPSNALLPAKFDTHGGLVRDGGSGTDDAGNARNSNRLEPPDLTTTNPATNLPRYQDLAMNSVARNYFDGTGPYPSAKSSAYGYGTALYIDNTSDIQSESTGLIGGYTLVDEWLHRTQSAGNSAWSASFYRPPGVEIVLGLQKILSTPSPGGTSTAESFYGVRMTRSDTDASGKPALWKNADGTDITVPNLDGNTGTTMVVSYTSLHASNDPAVDPSTLSGTAADNYKANPSNDVVIYAAGNVRIRGTASAVAGSAISSENATIDQLPRHITIVTAGTAYIEGSLLHGNPNSSISVLAHDYVCVNTTQFLAGAEVDQNPLGTTPPGVYSGDPNLRALDFSTSDEVLLQEFQYLPATTIQGLSAAAPALYFSGGASAPGTTSVDFDLINASTGISIANGSTNTLFQSPFSLLLSSAGATTANGLVHTTLPFSGISPAIQGSLSVVDPMQLAVRRSPIAFGGGGVVTTTATQDFLLERAAILPADIRIEAILFAQTRSFFVIPGDWFNSSSDDNLDAFVKAGSTLRPGIDSGINDQRRFPFFGQPIDMKIIISGSVSEARPADIAAQTEWMQKWGWIPQYHGSVFDPATSQPEAANRPSPFNTSSSIKGPGLGLTIIYNPMAAYPYDSGGTQYLRTDIYGRALPYTPKLPVCTGLLYAGQNSTDQPLLQ